MYDKLIVAKLKQRSGEVSEINNAGLLAKIRAKMNDNKNQSEIQNLLIRTYRVENIGINLS